MSNRLFILIIAATLLVFAVLLASASLYDLLRINPMESIFEAIFSILFFTAARNAYRNRNAYNDNHRYDY